jgi:hypothetical protein
MHAAHNTHNSVVTSTHTEVEHILSLEYFILGNLVAIIYLLFINPIGVLEVTTITVAIAYAIECTRVWYISKGTSEAKKGCNIEILNLLPAIGGAFLASSTILLTAKVGLLCGF